MRPAFFMLSIALMAPGFHPDVVRHVDHARLRVADVVPEITAPVADVDLGPAPPPGSSRLVPRDEVTTAVRQAGLSIDEARVPHAVRVVSASRHIDPEAFANEAAAAVRSALPAGVSLVRVEPGQALVVGPRASVRAAVIPPLAKKVGEQKTSATIEIASDGVSVAHVPAMIVVNVSAEAARPDVARGASIAIVIEEHGVHVSAAGSVLSDANVGDVVGVQVASTGRTLRARIVSRSEARVEGRP